jgi:hypothetical protein
MNDWRHARQHCGATVRWIDTVWVRTLRDRELVDIGVCRNCPAEALLLAKAQIIEPGASAPPRPSRWRWLWLNIDPRTEQDDRR